MSQPPFKHLNTKKSKQREPAKYPPKIKYEDTKKFNAFDRMMRGNKGVWLS